MQVMLLWCDITSFSTKVTNQADRACRSRRRDELKFCCYLRYGTICLVTYDSLSRVNETVYSLA